MRRKMLVMVMGIVTHPSEAQTEVNHTGNSTTDVPYELLQCDSAKGRVIIIETIKPSFWLCELGRHILIQNIHMYVCMCKRVNLPQTNASVEV